MRIRHWLLALLTLCSVPATAWSCEPIIPLVQLLSGSSLAGPAFLMQSVFWVAVAVAIKAGSFVFLERRLSWHRAVLFMVVANVVSTVPGVLVAVFTGSVAGIIFALPLIFGFGWMTHRRLALLRKPRHYAWLSGAGAALAFLVFFCVSVFLFDLAEAALGERSFAQYWMVKFLVVTLAAGTGMLISAVLEECVIARLSRQALGNLSFYPSVIRANYITLGAVLLVAAVKMLPQRLSAPHFIVTWLQSVCAAVGFT